MIRLALRVRRADAEIVLAELLELVPSGVEEVDVSAEIVEYAIYGPPGEVPTLPDLRAAARGAFVEVSTTEIADDWAERWRDFHKSLRIGDRLEVRPPWEAGTGAEIDLVIDPGRAFGTGAHATTALCLELLLEQAPGGGVLDLGCGSGVLAIAAAKLGFTPVRAVDYDPLSVQATTTNAAVNDVQLDVGRLDLRHEPVPAAGLVLANLLAPLLLQWRDAIAAERSARPRAVIASGLLVGEADRIAGAFAEVGLIERDRRARGDWAALLLSVDAR